MLQPIKKIPIPASGARFGQKPILVALALLLFCSGPSSFALELGSPAPDFSLKNVAGEAVDLGPPADGALLILIFFDSPDPAVDTIARLNEAANQSPDILRVLGISSGSGDALAEIAATQEEFAPILLGDDKGVTRRYGLRRKLPIAVIVGPGGRVGAMMAVESEPRGILMALADTLISLGFPESADTIYELILKENLSDETARLGQCYALVLAGKQESARERLRSLVGIPSVSSEARAAIGFLEYRAGRDSAALAECGRAPQSGFAGYVAGLVEARSGECEAAQSRFNKALKGRFAFRWQEALATAMAARTAEEAAGEEEAIELYRKAALLAPLNPEINANLLAHHWRIDNAPGAERYVQILDSLGSDDPLIQSLVNAFRSQRELQANAAARKQLKEKLSAGPGEDAGVGAPRKKSYRILIPDIAFIGCPSEMNSLPVIAAELLRRSLESAGPFVAVSRAEMLMAADVLGVPKDGLEDPVRLMKVAKALSADLVTLAEVGNHKRKYLVNVRIAEAISGVVVAVESRRMRSLDGLAPAVEEIATRLAEKIEAGYGR